MAKQELVIKMSISKRDIVCIIRTIRRERKLNSKIIERFIIFVIFVNSVTLGMETSDYLMHEFGFYLKMIDRIALSVFSIEIITKIIVKRLSFFKNPWNILIYSL